MPKLNTYYWLNDEPPPNAAESSVYLGNLDWQHATARDTSQMGKVAYVSHPYLMGSDYSGGSVERSNVNVFLEQFKDVDGVLEVYGGFGTYGVLVRRDVAESHDGIREAFESLERCPVLDEGDMSRVEMEAENEAWQSWAASDFRRALAKRFPQHEDAIEDIADDDLRIVLDLSMEQTNEYWENATGNSAYVDIDRILNRIDVRVLIGYLQGAGVAIPTPAA